MQPFGGKKKILGVAIVIAQYILPVLVMQQPLQQEDPRRQQTDDMVTLGRTFMLHQLIYILLFVFESYQ
jgi:hypothetical protein